MKTDPTHRFIHDPKFKCNNEQWYCDGTILKKESQLVGLIIDRDKKLICSANYNIGTSYGNSITRTNRWIPNDWTNIHITKGYEVRLSVTAYSFFRQYVIESIEYYQRKFMEYYGTLHGTVKYLHWYDNPNRPDIRYHILHKFGYSKADVLEVCKSIKDLSTVYYSKSTGGWGSSDQNVIKLDKPIPAHKFINGIPMSDEDVNTVDAKSWLWHKKDNNYERRMVHWTDEEVRIASATKESRKAFDKHIQDTIKTFKDKESEEYIKKLANQLAYEQEWAKTTDLIDKWRNKDVGNDKLCYKLPSNANLITHHNAAYLRIDNDRVETSKGVVVTLADAKRTLSIFRLYVARTTVEVNESKEVVIKNEKCNMFNINKVIVTNDEDTTVITIGCHEITLAEVNRFIKYYNLDW